MSYSTSTLVSHKKEWKIYSITKGNSCIQVVPEAGFSMISFKWKNQELLDQWDLDTFLGDSNQTEFISKNITDSFRKGFAPSIGPWFNTKSSQNREWQHGVCRYAEWKDIEVGNDYIKATLDGNKDTLLGKTLNEITGFLFKVEIIYCLTENGLEYTIKNLSEKQLGTFGIHWYWKSYPNSKMRLKTDLSNLPKDLTEGRYMVGNGEVLADLNIRNGDIFQNVSIGSETVKGSIEYPDSKKINFFYDDNFQITVLFNTKDGCCFEPISGMPHQIGSFTEGTIRIQPLGF